MERLGCLLQHCHWPSLPCFIKVHNSLKPYKAGLAVNQLMLQHWHTAACGPGDCHISSSEIVLPEPV